MCVCLTEAGAHTRVTRTRSEAKNLFPNARQSDPPSGFQPWGYTRSRSRSTLNEYARWSAARGTLLLAASTDRSAAFRSVPSRVCPPPPFPPKASSTTLPATPIRRFVSLPAPRCCASNPTPAGRRARLFFLPCSASQTPFTRVRARPARGGVATPRHRQRRETGVVLLEREQNATTMTRREKGSCCSTQPGGCANPVQLLFFSRLYARRALRL